MGASFAKPQGFLPSSAKAKKVSQRGACAIHTLFGISNAHWNLDGTKNFLALTARQSLSLSLSLSSFPACESVLDFLLSIGTFFS